MFPLLHNWKQPKPVWCISEELKTQKEWQFNDDPKSESTQNYPLFNQFIIAYTHRGGIPPHTVPSTYDAASNNQYQKIVCADLRL